MNKVKLHNGLITCVIISVIILVVLYIYYLRVKNIHAERFNDSVLSNSELETLFSEDGNVDQTSSRIINFKNNFYDSTPATESNILRNTSGTDDLGYSIGGANLCIYTTNAAGTEVTDIECITSGEFNNALELPKARRETVCIDEECLDLKEAKFLLGETDFQIKTCCSLASESNYKTSDCLTKKRTPIYSCSGHNYGNNIGSYLSWDTCYYKDSKRANTEFILDQDLGMTLSELNKFGATPIPDPVAGSGGDDGNAVLATPVH